MVSFVQFVVFALIIGVSSILVDGLKEETSEKKKTRKGRWRRRIVSWSGAIAAALIGLLANSGVDWVGKHLERPSIDIKTSNADDVISFSIKVPSGATIERIALNYPVLGVAGKLNDLTDLTAARTAVAQAVGASTKAAVQNNLELLINDIESGHSLEYKLPYEPYDPSQVRVSIPATDYYRLFYVWRYQGEWIEESELRSVQNDEIVSEPPFQVWGAEIYHRVLTREELKQLYREGPPRRPVE